MAEALPPPALLEDSQEQGYFDFTQPEAVAPPSQRHTSLNFDFEDAGFEVFDPRGLFSPVKEPGASLPFGAPEAATSQLTETQIWKGRDPTLPDDAAASAHDDGSAQPRRPVLKPSVSGVRRTPLPALQIPGLHHHASAGSAASMPTTAVSEETAFANMDIDDDDGRKGLPYGAQRELARAREEGMPGLSSSASDNALSSTSSIPGTPASPSSRRYSDTNGPGTSKTGPASSRSPPPSRGRDQLRRMILSTKLEDSPSPSPSLDGHINGSANGGNESAVIRESGSANSLSASMSASQILPQGSGPRDRRGSNSSGKRTPWEPRSRKGSLLQRAETSPPPRVPFDDCDESIGSDAYSDMISSPAVSFLSAFADSTNNSLLARSRSLKERSAVKRSRNLSGATAFDGGTEEVDMKDVEESTYLSVGGMMEAQEDEEGDEVAGYVLGPLLGRGGFSVVRAATDTSTGARVAVKIIRRPATAIEAPGLGGGKTNGTSKANLGVDAKDFAGAVRDRSFSVPAPFDARAAGLDRASFRLAPSNGTTPIAEEPPAAAAMAGWEEEKNVEKYLQKEIAVWSKLEPHPNVLPMLGVHREGPGIREKRTYLFMPLCEGGNLLQLLNEHGSRLRSMSGSGSRSAQDRSSAFKLPNGIRRFTEPISVMRAANSAIAEDEEDGDLGPRGLDLPHVKHIFGQLVKGLEHLHCEAGVTHRDLKLENVLIHEGTFRIADFGLASVVSAPVPFVTPGASTPSGRVREASDPLAASWAGPDWRHHVDPRHSATDGVMPSFAQAMPSMWSGNGGSSGDDGEPSGPGGSLPYTAPEQLRSRTTITDHSIDIWALGCILYALLEGRLPFNDDFEPRLRLLILRGTWNIPTVLERKKELWEAQAVERLLRGCLEMDPQRRWTIRDVTESEWLADPNDDFENRGRRRSRSRRPLMRRLTSAGGSPSFVLDEDDSYAGGPRRNSRQSSAASARSGSGSGGSRPRNGRRGRSNARRLSITTSPAMVVDGSGGWGEHSPTYERSPSLLSRSRRQSEDFSAGGGVERMGRSIHRDFERKDGMSPSHSRSHSRRRGAYR